MAKYDIKITDSSGTSTMPLTNIPLSTKTIEGSVDITTLDFNIYTDYVAQKRVWEHTWAYMTKDEYDVFKGFYDRQFVDYKYPKITIEDENVNQVVARMTIDVKNIVDKCGTVENVKVSFRETRQLGD